MIISKKITVFGKVQGVFFRKHTKEKCIELGLKGFVQNQEDGTVYIEVEGDPNQVSSLLEWCKVGSPKSKVTDIKVEDLEPTSFRKFEVRW